MVFGARDRGYHVDRRSRGSPRARRRAPPRGSGSAAARIAGGVRRRNSLVDASGAWVGRRPAALAPVSMAVTDPLSFPGYGRRQASVRHGRRPCPCLVMGNDARSIGMSGDSGQCGRCPATFPRRRQPRPRRCRYASVGNDNGAVTGRDKPTPGAVTRDPSRHAGPAPARRPRAPGSRRAPASRRPGPCAGSPASGPRITPSRASRRPATRAGSPASGPRITPTRPVPRSADPGPWSRQAGSAPWPWRRRSGPGPSCYPVVAPPGAATSVTNRCSNVAAGSAVIPVCASDGWMIVDDGATSQW
jgi:hypothetical protein